MFEELFTDLRSDEDILAMSFGEVSSERIFTRFFNYESSGLFSEQIFGPINSYTCHCTKFRGQIYEGVVCDRCKVEVTSNSTRYNRIGHISLCVPFVDPRFYIGDSSILDQILGLKEKSASDLVSYYKHVITNVDPKIEGMLLFVEGSTIRLQRKQIITEAQLYYIREHYSSLVQTAIGADAIKDLLSQEDINKRLLDLREKYSLSSNETHINSEDKLSVFKLINEIIESHSDFRNIVLKYIPVNPPGLRPIIRADNKHLISKISVDYRDIIIENNKLRELFRTHAPIIIIRNGCRQLQQAIKTLYFDYARLSDYYVDYFENEDSLF